MSTITTPSWAHDTELTPKQFSAISDMVRSWSGINLHVGKMALVKARLNRRLRTLGMRSFGEYVEHVAEDAAGAEKSIMLEALTTHLTHFFREPKHFDFLRETVIPQMLLRHKHDRRIRIWSAGCSSGEEPYSIAMVLQEAAAELAGWDLGILATDLSQKVIDSALDGTYEPHQLRETSARRIHDHFTLSQRHSPCSYRVKAGVRQLVHFCRLNLVDRWPMKGPFDAIFCRNVMIYFDKPTQQRLIERFSEILCPGGVLFLGHAESLAGVRHRFEYLAPAVYQRSLN
ncbi:MAG: protein-glutamate O-methyltransferase CheR [Planctomycetia bacterium]|nr:protein-glutamate O-methyltransferase CheR [Planctomycetia bacterium]